MKTLEYTFSCYQISTENHKTVIKILEKDPALFSLNTIYAAQTFAEAKEKMLIAYKELEDLAIVSMVSVFEQKIINHIDEIADTIKNQNSGLAKAVIDYGLKDPGRWRFKEILDLYKTILPSNLVGQIKQIYEFRNWVAHGKKKPKPISVDPKSACQILTEFLELADLEEHTM